MNGAISKLFVKALAHKPYQNVASWWLELNLTAQITLCHWPGPFWIRQDAKIHLPQKKNTGADKLLIIPSIAGLTPCKDLPKFVKKWKVLPKKLKIPWENLRDSCVRQNALWFSFWCTNGIQVLKKKLGRSLQVFTPHKINIHTYMIHIWWHKRKSVDGTFHLYKNGKK